MGTPDDTTRAWVSLWVPTKVDVTIEVEGVRSLGASQPAVETLGDAARRLGKRIVSEAGRGYERTIYVATGTAESGSFTLRLDADTDSNDAAEPVLLPDGDHYFELRLRARTSGRSVARGYRLRMDTGDATSGRTSQLYIDDHAGNSGSLMTWWPGDWSFALLVFALASTAAALALVGRVQAGLWADVLGVLMFSLPAVKRELLFTPGMRLGGGSAAPAPVQLEQDRLTVRLRCAAVLLVLGFALQLVGTF